MTKSLLLILLSISIAVVGQILLKAGMDEIGPISMAQIRNASATARAVFLNWQVMLGLSLYALAAVAWLIVLSRVNLSFAYPMLGFSYVMVMLLSRFIFKEQVSVARWVGAALIAFGVILISGT